MAAGQIGSQALKLGLIDQMVVNRDPVVIGLGRPFFATGGLTEPLPLENPTTIVRGDRVTHPVYASATDARGHQRFGSPATCWSGRPPSRPRSAVLPADLG